VALPGQQQAQQVGQIQLATFANPGGLNSTGQTCSCPPPLPATPSWAPWRQRRTGHDSAGALEQSNVNVVEEFVDMILAQRSYESNSKVVQAADQMFQDVNSMSR
jgi:flagellar basal-body rod protein FlgG